MLNTASGFLYENPSVKAKQGVAAGYFVCSRLLFYIESDVVHRTPLEPPLAVGTG